MKPLVIRCISVYKTHSKCRCGWQKYIDPFSWRMQVSLPVYNRFSTPKEDWQPYPAAEHFIKAAISILSFHFTLAVFNSVTGFLHIHLSLSGHLLILSHSLLFNLNLILNSPSLNLPFTKFRSLRIPCLVSHSIYSFFISFDCLLFALNLVKACMSAWALEIM